MDPPEYWGLNEYESIGTMVKRIREREMERSIDLIVAKADHPKVLRLKARRRHVKPEALRHKCGEEKSRLRSWR